VFDMSENVRATQVNATIARYGHGGVGDKKPTTKGVYVQNPDDWARLTAYADEHKMSVSEVIFTGLSLLIENKCKTCARVAEVLSTAGITVSGSVTVKAAKAKK